MRRLLSLLLAVLMPLTCFADETISSGLTLVIPSAGQTNWHALFRDDFATPISAHRHTGSPDGLTMVTDSYSDNSVTGAKIRLANDNYLRGRNAANSADINVIKVNSSDQILLGATLVTPTLSSALGIASGGTGGTTESAARTALGLAIGTHVQAFDAQLTDVAGLTPTDNNFIVGNGTNFVAESGSTARSSLGVAIGSDVQGYDAQLADVSGLTPTDNAVIIGNGSNFVVESGATALTSLGAAARGANSDITELTGVALTSCSPGVTANGGATIGTVVVNQCQYQRIGGLIHFVLSLTFPINTAAPTILTVDTPWTATADSTSAAYSIAADANGTGLALPRARCTAGGIVVFQAGGATFATGTNASINIKSTCQAG